MYFSEMFDTAEEFMYQIKERLGDFDECVDFNETYQEIEQDVTKLKNLTNFYSLEEGTTNEITINIKTF
jgi:hypothetical protein